MRQTTGFAGMVVLGCGLVVSAQPLPAPPDLGPVASYGQNIQRTMTLLATSTPEHRHPVRVLFYGQSITAQAWTKLVEQSLRARFPHADLTVANRAIGGHSSQLLVKTAEADLYPFYPDLLIFHVYGSHGDYDTIIRRTRERTTAEILMQNDHLTKPEDLTEPTDPARLVPRGDQWNAFMNHKWLPEVARRYGAELCDQRRIWKTYLQTHHLEPKAFLKDGVHLNAAGEALMAECVNAYLRYDPAFPKTPWQDLVRQTLPMSAELSWNEGKLTLPFQGNRVDLLVAPGPGNASVEVRIDGKKPSEFPELYGFNRVSAYPGLDWPCLLRVQSQAPLVLEEWTLTLSDVSADGKFCRFSLAGSVTGPDGSGQSDRKFVSRSGRVVIEPEDWNIAYAVKVVGRKSPDPQKALPDGFVARWKVLPHFQDRVVVPTAPGDPAREYAITLAQGLANAPHTLTLTGGPDVRIRGVRIYRPPLAAKP